MSLICQLCKKPLGKCYCQDINSESSWAHEYPVHAQETARSRAITMWVLKLSNEAPNGLTFKEVQDVLNHVEKQVQDARLVYPL